MDDKQLPQQANSKPQISNATVKKPSFARDLGKFALEEVIIPQSKDMMSNFFKSVINMFSDSASKVVDKTFYPDGNAPRRPSSRPGEYHPRTNYSTTVYTREENKPPRESINSRSSIEVNYIWVDTEDQARQIVSSLIEDIDNYGKAKVATLYDMVKIPTNFTDFKFGWTEREVKSIGYYRDRGKYFIDLPKPVNIENV